MRSTLVLVALALGLVLAAVPLPVAAHVNHVSADAQVSDDGTLVAETAFVGADGYLVVHRSDGGDIGEPIGHVPLLQAGGLETDVRVTIDSAVWADWTTQEIWLVLHNSDGDGRFDPENDPVLETFGQAAGERVTVAKGASALVTAEAFAPQRLNASHTTVTVRTATHPRDGAVVVRNGTDGRELGRTALSAGRHANVTVGLNESFLASHEQFTASAVLVDDAGETITAGEEPVATTFGVRYRGDVNATPTPALVQTATPTPTDEGVPSDDTDSATPTGPEAATDGPGFGLLAALAALVLAGLVGWNRA
ncbi:DUF7282 domain-containing protein [Halorarius litoreus]|uniref:DUF7282 domain-containing protein n=1 Tax=Halorarius litoreus TaxID=2962676 RepID=UPI0020CDB47B|nr:hypothetical protein [Halorarius litoreus]